MKALGLTLLTVSLSAVAAQAQSQLDAASDVQVLFDPFDGRAAVATLRFDIRHDEAEPPAALQLRPVDGDWRLHPVGLRYGLRTSDGRESGGPALNAPVRAPDARRTSDLSVDVVVPALQFAEAGEATAELEATLLDRAGAPIGSPRRVRVTAVVPPRAQANIAGARGAFGSQPALPFIDFGEMQTGETRNAFLQVRANAAAAITAVSQNGGRLVNDDAPDSPGVPYRLEIDGVAASLESPLTLQRRPPASLDGASYPMRFTLGDVSGAYAGTYRDVVTVDVTAM